MKVIYDAIADVYEADTALVAALPGGLSLQRREQQTGNQPLHPYATYFKVTQVPEYTFTEIGENVTVQFDIFDNSSSVITICAAAAALKACFDLCDLTVTGYSHIYMVREWETETMLTDGIWQISIQYRLIIQKVR